jgi:hypothetical protein
MTNVTLTASEFQDHVGDAFDRSLSQPVVPTKHRRPRNVVHTANTSDRARHRLSDDELAAIGASGMEHGFEHLNAELEGQ